MPLLQNQVVALSDWWCEVVILLSICLPAGNVCHCMSLINMKTKGASVKSSLQGCCCSLVPLLLGPTRCSVDLSALILRNAGVHKSSLSHCLWLEIAHWYFSLKSFEALLHFNMLLPLREVHEPSTQSVLCKNERLAVKHDETCHCQDAAVGWELCPGHLLYKQAVSRSVSTPGRGSAF